MIRIFISGRHSRRLPFSYRALAPLFDGQVALVDSPDKADLYLFAHVLDIQDTDLSVVRDWRARRCPVVLMSEEPFWDTIWCRRPLRRELRVETTIVRDAQPVCEGGRTSKGPARATLPLVIHCADGLAARPV